MLEVIDKGACSEAHPTPLLFVHGAWHGAWCWDEYFLSYFADKGYRAVALSLRGHGNSPTPKPVRWCSIADYVDDAVSVADSLPLPPVVIGHSMGGFIVQKYLESHGAPAGVLVASVPARGARGFLLRLFRRDFRRTMSATLTGDSLQIFNTPERARRYFFSADVPEPDVVRHTARLGPESQRLTIDATALRLPRPKRIATPLLVLGGEQDACFTTKEIHATARAYGTEAEIFPDMGHDMMLEPGWQTVADRIDAWLTARGL
ncbi:MAG TPA: alpha/beta hydrolase [Mycobacterium sp.]|nr:alpha/beta hydrolase [Mycobacterium sp.]